MVGTLSLILRDMGVLRCCECRKFQIWFSVTFLSVRYCTGNLSSTPVSSLFILAWFVPVVVSLVCSVLLMFLVSGVSAIGVCVAAACTCLEFMVPGDAIVWRLSSGIGSDNGCSCQSSPLVFPSCSFSGMHLSISPSFFSSSCWQV